MLASPAPRLLLSALPAAAALALLGWSRLGWGPAPLVAAAAASLLVSRALRTRVAAVLSQVARAHSGLAALAAVSARLEREPFRHPRLVALRVDLLSGGRASRRIGALGSLVGWLALLNNDLAAPLAQLLGGPASLAFAIERWRSRSGRRIGAWLQAAGEIEALCALAGHGYEHPSDPFPELIESGAVLDGRGLRHPLLPEARCVPNDVLLGGDGPSLLLLSGSNMSGKSTLLRTVGANAVLAFAGAPVRARRLRVSPLALGASLRAQDSLVAGESRFYAEILRLRRIVALLDGPLRVLFLLDEILHGTNSHDRRQGAEGVLRGCSIAARSGSAPRTISRSRRWSRRSGAAAPTRTSATSCGTGSCASTTRCGPASSASPTRSS